MATNEFAVFEYQLKILPSNRFFLLAPQSGFICVFSCLYCPGQKYLFVLHPQKQGCKMWQSAELKYSEMWNETSAHNHLHKWGLWDFGFSSHLPGILHFLCADQVTDNAFDIWTPFSWVHCIRLFFNNFCALFFIRYVSFPYKNAHNGSFRILLKLKVSWLMKDLCCPPIRTMSWNVKYAATCSKQNFIHLISLMHLDRYLMRTSVSHDSIAYFTWPGLLYWTVNELNSQSFVETDTLVHQEAQKDNKF